MVRSSSRKCPSSPPSPSVYWRGARLRELLKCTFPFPPAPPRQSTISCPSRARSTTEIADCRWQIANCSEFDGQLSTFDVGFFSSPPRQTIAPPGPLTILPPPARPLFFSPTPCPPL